MAVPAKRNEKKTRTRPKQLYRATRLPGIKLDGNPYFSKDGHFIPIEETPTFEEWLEDTEPVDPIEEMVNNPGRVLSIMAQADPDDDIINDLEDLYEDY